MPEPAITLVPSEVRVGRVVDEGGDWIVLTYVFDLDGEDAECRVAISPDDFVSMLVAGLNGLGFPEGDREYIAARWAREGG